MKDRIETSTCERNADLVAFLYQELDEREVRDFEQHLDGCAPCRGELASFKDIRAAVVAWREQSLGMAPQQTRDTLPWSHCENPSAFAAIRKFLELSPVWLKGALAFASILFFALVSFLLLNLNSRTEAPLVRSEKVYSEEEMRARVEAGIQAHLKELSLANANPPKEKVERRPSVAQDPKPRSKSSGVIAKTRRSPLTKSEREQLAADLRLISPTEDLDLDLLGEQINR